MGCAAEGRAEDMGYVVHWGEGFAEVDCLFDAEGGESWVCDGPSVWGFEVVLGLLWLVLACGWGKEGRRRKFTSACRTRWMIIFLGVEGESGGEFGEGRQGGELMMDKRLCFNVVSESEGSSFSMLRRMVSQVASLVSMMKWELRYCALEFGAQV